MARCTIVIPQKDNSPLTSDLIRGILAHETDVQLRVIHDSPQEKIRPIPGASIELNRSYGVTAAWNQGCESAGEDWIIVMNNDVLCGGSFVDRMIESATVSGMSGVGIRHERMIGKSSNRLPGGSSAEWLQGWCFCFHRNVFADLMGFDETLKYYFSDLDFQVRLKLRGGCLKPVFCDELVHLGHRTAHTLPNQKALWREDQQAFIRKVESGAFDRKEE